MTKRSPRLALANAAWALALFVGAAALRAQAPPPPRSVPPSGDRQAEDRWWRDHALLPRLDLEPERRERLEKTYTDARARLDDISATAVRAESDLAAVTHALEPDQRAFEPRLERMVAAHEQLEREQMRLLLTVRGLLTPAQWSRLQDLQRTVNQPGTEPAPGVGSAHSDGARPGAGPRSGGPMAQGGPPPRDGRPPEPGPPPPPGGRPGARPPGPPLPPGTWWRDLRIAADFDVDPSQAAALDAAFEARRDALADSRESLEGHERALGALLPAPALDLAAALAASEHVAHARAELDRVFIALRFAQWQLLRADQRERLLRPPPR